MHILSRVKPGEIFMMCPMQEKLKWNWNFNLWGAPSDHGVGWEKADAGDASGECCRCNEKTKEKEGRQVWWTNRKRKRRFLLTQILSDLRWRTAETAFTLPNTNVYLWRRGLKLLLIMTITTAKRLKPAQLCSVRHYSRFRFRARHNWLTAERHTDETL